VEGLRETRGAQAAGEARVGVYTSLGLTHVYTSQMCPCVLFVVCACSGITMVGASSNLVM
jgi:hypothetical protein